MYEVSQCVNKYETFVPPRILWLAILNFFVSKLAQICQFSLRTGSFVQKFGKREKERRGGGVGGGKLKMSLQG